MVTKNELKTPKKERRTLAFYVGFVIISLAYLIYWLTFSRAYTPALITLLPQVIYPATVLLACAYALAQPKLQKTYLDITLIIGEILLLLLNLLNLFTYPKFSVATLVFIVNIIVLLVSLTFLFARIMHKPIPRKFGLALIIIASAITFVSLFCVYSTFWPRSLYRSYSDGQYVLSLIAFGLGGLLRTAQAIGWMLVIWSLPPQPNKSLTAPQTDA